MGGSGGGESPTRAALLSYACIALCISLSGSVILLNKWILAYGGFPYPITLTLSHMAFSAALSAALVRGGWVEGKGLDSDTYLCCILPIGACYAGTLWVGNAAYLYLSVSFIQMLKALCPCAVFLVGCAFGTDAFRWATLSNMVVVAVGVAIASYGEINFHLLGVFCQLASILTESTRLVLVQILLQSRGLVLNPVTTLYYVAPCCFGFLLLPWMYLEAERLFLDTSIRLGLPVLLASAAIAFALNVVVFLLIGWTSALTARVAGVVKDWMLILLSIWLFRAPVTALNLGGYVLALMGVGWYNYSKLVQWKQDTQEQQRRQQDEVEAIAQKEELPLLLQDGESSVARPANGKLRA
eukprot:scaffold6.g2687.t1